ASRTVRPEEEASVRRKIGVVRFALYGSPGFGEQPADQWRFIAYDESGDASPQQAWLPQIRRHRPVVFAASASAAQQMAARSGSGAGVSPTIVGDSDAMSQRSAVEGEAPSRDLWSAVFPDSRRSPAVKAVMDFSVECVQQEPRLRA
ncbi:hypothetical protein OY671_010393, partial [Metschnikowia pulcherrima]